MIPLFTVQLRSSDKLEQMVKTTLDSGFITEGETVKIFERAFSTFLWGQSVLALNSCTSALTLALRLAGVGHGDYVLTTPMTCTATNMPILASGANVAWADINPKTGILNAESVAQNITPRTKAVIVVAWGGNLGWDYVDLHALCEKRGIPLIVDSAHSPVSIAPQPDFACYSFQAIKHLTTGDGGALVCKSESDHERGKLLRWFGIDRDYRSGGDFRMEPDIEEWGYKFHMNNIAATLGLYQMPRLAERLNRCHEISKFYSNTIPLQHTPLTVAPWLYTLLLPDAPTRIRFQEFMTKRQIQVSQVHRRNDTQPCFRASRVPTPGVDEFVARMCCIPLRADLLDDEVNEIVRAAKDFCGQTAAASAAQDYLNDSAYGSCW